MDIIGYALELTFVVAIAAFVAGLVVAWFIFLFSPSELTPTLAFGPLCCAALIVLLIEHEAIGALARWSYEAVAAAVVVGLAFGVGATLFVVGKVSELLGLTQRQPSHHGSAAFATEEELAGLLASDEHSGLPLARVRNKLVVLPPALALRHVAVRGPTGAGKTRSIILPALAAWRGGILTTDPKAEAWEYRHYHPRPHIALAPTEPERSASLNWIPLCRHSDWAHYLAEALVMADGPSQGDAYWRDLAVLALAAAWQDAAHTRCPTPSTALRILQLPHAALAARWNGLRHLDAVALARTSLADARTFQQARTEALTKLTWLSRRDVAAATSSSFDPLDFSHLRRGGTAYWLCPESESLALRRLSALVWSIALRQLIETEGEAVLLAMDEVANLGRLALFPEIVNVGRGRGVAVVLSLQTGASLEQVYGQAAGAILAACQTRVYLAGLAAADAEAASRDLGSTTIRYTTVSQAQGVSQVNEAFARRALLTPDEVRRIAPDEVLIVSANHKPLRARRLVWTWPARTEPCPCGCDETRRTAAEPLAFLS